MAGASDVALAATSNTPSSDTPAMEAFQVEDETRAVEDKSAYPAGHRFFFVILSITLGLCTVAVDSSIVSTAVPAITIHFGTIKDIGCYYSAW